MENSSNTMGGFYLIQDAPSQMWVLVMNCVPNIFLFRLLRKIAPSSLFFSPLVLFNNMAIYGLFHLNRTLHRFPCEKVGVRQQPPTVP